MLPPIFLKLPSKSGHFIQIAPSTFVSQGELFFSLHPTRVFSERSSTTQLSLTKCWLTRAPPTAMILVCSLRQSLASTSLCLLHSSAAETTTICGTSWSRGTRGWYAMLRYTNYYRTAFVHVDMRCFLAHNNCFETTLTTQKSSIFHFKSSPLPNFQCSQHKSFLLKKEKQTSIQI